jgi:integrase
MGNRPAPAGWKESLAMPAWINAGRNLRYREHPHRKHGRRPDRYWSLHYTVDSRGHTEGVGWWSQGVTQALCRGILAELSRNRRTGAGPRTLKELREAGRAGAAAEGESRKAALTLERFWTETVLPQIRLTCARENAGQSEGRIRAWLSPLLDRPLAAIKTSDLEMKVVKPMLAAGRKPATVELVLRLFSMVWHKARNLELVTGDCPVIRVKRPEVDNRRVRFLSPAEAARLLAALKERSADAHDLALLSLFTGLRAGECSALTWADVDFENGLIFVKDTKNKHNRHAFMTAEVRAMLARRREAGNAPRVFQGRRGGSLYWAADQPFRETVRALGLNDGLSDPRQMVVFHTLRHTFASWLVMRGKPLYTVGRLMGHRDIRMTRRYAHLAPEVRKAAVSRLEGFLTGGHGGDAVGGREDGRVPKPEVFLTNGHGGE